MRSGYRGAEWVYYCDDGRGRIKIGYSLNPWQRVAEFQTINPEIAMVVTESGDRDLERLRHEQFHEEHIAGEWFLRSERLDEWLEFLFAISRIENR